MPASKYERAIGSSGFSDAESATAGGRSTVDTSDLDTELNDVLAVISSHADDLDTLLRDDGKMMDDILQGHEFSATAISVLKGLVGNKPGVITWRGEWAATTAYEVGDIIRDGVGDGSTYWCETAHTSGSALATDIAGDATLWDKFMDSPSGSVFPTPTGAYKVLARDVGDTSNEYTLVTSNHIDSSVAPSASPTFTGTITAVAATLSGLLTLNGSVTLGVLDNGNMTGADVLALNGKILQKGTITGNVTLTTSGRAAGKRIEVVITSDPTTEYTLTESEGWTWVGYKPPSFLPGKSGVLTLLCMGAAATDIYASWAEEF